MGPSAPLPRISRLDLALFLLVFVLLFVLYVHTAGPSLGGLYDSEEYQWTAYALDFAPSTGYPLYLLLGKVWIALVPFGTVAHRMNLLSGFLAALACAVLYVDGRILTRGRIAPLMGAIWLGISPSFWFQASVASVSPLHILLLGSIFLSLFYWAAGRAPLELVALLIGLSLAHHRSTLLVLPAVACFVWLLAPTIWRSPKTLLRAFLVGVAPLLLYVYIPFTADPAVDRGYILYQILNGGSTLNSPEQQLLLLQQEVAYLWQWLWLPGIALWLIGLGAAIFRKDTFSLSRLPITVLLLGSALPLAVMPIVWALELERYATVVFFLSLFWVIAGIHFVLRELETRLATGRLQYAARAALVLVLAVWLAANFPASLSAAKAGANDKEYGLWNEILSLPIEDRAEILVNWSELNAMRYMQVVEQRRRDLQPVRIDQDVRLEQAEIQAALKRGQPIYLMPSAPQVAGSYHYSAAGPLVRVNPGALFTAPAAPFAVEKQGTSDIDMVGFGLSRSLQPDPPNTQIGVPAGSTVRVGIVWRANSAPARDYQVRMRLADGREHVWSQSKEGPVRGRYPTSAWQANEVVPDSHGLLIPPGTPPGEYRIMLDWIDPASAAIQTVAGGPPTVTVQPTHSPADQVFVRKRVNAVFGDRLSLLGLNSSAQLPRSGDKFTVALVWQAKTDLQEDYAVAFRLLDTADAAVQEWGSLPIIPTLPTSLWRQGDTYQGLYDFVLPPESGSHPSLSIGVVDKQGRRLPVRTIAGTNPVLAFLKQFGLWPDFSSAGAVSSELVLFSSSPQ